MVKVSPSGQSGRRFYRLALTIQLKIDFQMKHFYRGSRLSHLLVTNYLSRISRNFKNGEFEVFENKQKKVK